MDISDEQFERLIGEALDELPEKYVSNMQNVAITYEDEPSPRQREELKLHCHETLFGLYEGIPLTKRGAGYNLVLPDKITIFKLPILRAVTTEAELKKQIKHTLWHEIAHHFGLDHARIHQLEREAF
ncbi:MAG TPA: metallopeptidase family protein [Candidatus Saccharimonadales bacterium]|nr:metallopeptidase family protein [Candidatus Saccharimonadales bacterium]